MVAKKKLTPAQLTLLREKRGGFLDTYKPGLKLMELGLIDVTGTGYYRWSINVTGEALLATIPELEVKGDQKIAPNNVPDLAWPVLKKT